MKKTLTMQEILNDNQLLKALSEFREESEIKDFCEKLSLEINSTILYNLKKTLECQIEQIENANKPLTTEILKDVAGGHDDGDYGVTTSVSKLNGTDSAHLFGTICNVIVDVGLNIGFSLQTVLNTKAILGARAAELASGEAAGLGSRAAAKQERVLTGTNLVDHMGEENYEPYIPDPNDFGGQDYD